MRTLLTLPPEIQLMIARCVDEKDVLTLNLTCRPLRSLLEPVIADIFGSDRSFHLSIPGMSALLHFSMDTVTAPYLRTLVIFHPGARQSASCYRLLHKALQKFGAYGKLQSIGVRHVDDGVNFVSDKQLAHDHIRLFLDETMNRSAREAGLLFKNIIFEVELGSEMSVLGVNRRKLTLSPGAIDEYVTEVDSILTTMHTLRSTLSSEVSRTFRFVKKGVEGTRHSAATLCL